MPSRADDHLVTLRRVRRWAQARRIPAHEFLVAYRTSYKLGVARLTQAIYRERLCGCRVTGLAGLGPCLVIGRGSRLLIPIAPRAFARFEIETWPACFRSPRIPVQWSGRFLRELGRVLARTPLEAHWQRLTDDFRNSLANSVLNLLLAARPGVLPRALEPAYQGHHYYPFAALRAGPSIEQIETCSHLNADPVEVPLLEVSALAFRSAVFHSAAECLRVWSGARNRAANRAIPIHPWQLEISPVVAALVEARGARILRARVACRPLASQRTMRVLATGYDIKLAADAWITSEHRLLFRLNCENAPFVSALAQRLLEERAAELPFAIQPDVASLSFADERIASHLSAIVRAPVTTLAGERAIPAIDLWTGRELAAKLLRGVDREGLKRFFRCYCRVAMTGPVAFLLKFGLGFEPHLQNSIVVFRGRTPVRLVLRDLDGTMMDPSRVAPLLETFGLQLAQDTWERVPSARVGEHRLVHALFFAHLALVVDFLATRFGCRADSLLRILGREWCRVPAAAKLGESSNRFDALTEHLEQGKSMLIGRLERSASVGYMKLPAHQALTAKSMPFWRELAATDGSRRRQRAVTRPRPGAPIRFSELAAID